MEHQEVRGVHHGAAHRHLAGEHRPGEVGVQEDLVGVRQHGARQPDVLPRERTPVSGHVGLLRLGRWATAGSLRVVLAVGEVLAEDGARAGEGGDDGDEEEEEPHGDQDGHGPAATAHQLSAPL